MPQGLHQRPIHGLGMDVRANQGVLHGLQQNVVRCMPVGDPDRRDPHGPTVAEGPLGKLQAACAPVVAAVLEQTHDTVGRSAVASPGFIELGILG